MTTVSDDFGSALRWWRTSRRFSQLDLATAAEVSSRHLSFLETGKAKPSREMVVHLGVVLELPLRDRNALLHAAGFAPVYPHTDFDAPELDQVRTVLRTILDAHGPNPAMIVDRRGDVIDSNGAAQMLIVATMAADSRALHPVPNVNRVTFHPEGIRRRTRNWEEVATNILRRLERERAFRPADEQLDELVEEMLGYPDVAALHRRPELPDGADLLVHLEIETFGGDELRLMTTVATIGAPYDVTLDELRLETFFPADTATAATLAGFGV